MAKIGVTLVMTLVGAVSREVSRAVSCAYTGEVCRDLSRVKAGDMRRGGDGMRRGNLGRCRQW